MLVAPHPVHVKPACLAVSLLELILEGTESGIGGCFCFIGKGPTLFIHHRVASEEILTGVDFA